MKVKLLYTITGLKSGDVFEAGTIFEAKFTTFMGAPTAMLELPNDQRLGISRTLVEKVEE